MAGDLSDAFSGGLSGAGIGTAILPGIGTAIGGGLGILGGLIFGEDEPDTASAQQERQKKLLALLQGNYNDAKNTSTTDSAFFRSGSAKLREILGDQSKSDRAQRVRTGSSGGEMAIAQAAQRSDTLTEGLSALLSDSERFQVDRRSRALGRLLQGQGLGIRRAGMQHRADRAAQSNIAGVVSAAAPAILDLLAKK